MSKQSDQHDDANDDQHDEDTDEQHELQAEAASESGPTTYDQAAWVDESATGEAAQKPNVVVYGEAGVHHENEWTEPSTSRSNDQDETVAKVVRAEESDEPSHSTAATKSGRPDRFARR